MNKFKYNMGLKSLYYSYRSQALILKTQQKIIPSLLLVIIGYVLSHFFAFYTLEMGLMFILIGTLFLIINFYTLFKFYKEYTKSEFYKKEIIVTYDEKSISFSTKEPHTQKYSWEHLLILSYDKFGLRCGDKKGKHLFFIPQCSENIQHIKQLEACIVLDLST